MNKYKAVLVSWDIFASIALGLLTFFVLPEYLNIVFTKSFYSIGISVLSIIFSLFFAALAIIMSSSDNDFIQFLEEKNNFTGLLWTFKYTLALLFISLIYSIVFYTISEYLIENSKANWEMHKLIFVIFEFLFCYSMLATFLAVLDTIQFSKFRAVFLSNRNKSSKI